MKKHPHLALAVIILLLLPLLRVDTSHAATGTRTPYLNSVEPVVSSAGFLHPGVYVDLPTLELVRQRIADGAEPWTSIYVFVREGRLVGQRPDWNVFSDALDTSRPCDPDASQGCVLDCDTTTCKKELRDQINSAYTNALLWYYSGDEEYARDAVGMLNAYARTLRGFTAKAETTDTGILEAGWTAQTLIRAAEIIRYTYTPSIGDPEFDVEAFSSMIGNVLVPRLDEEMLNRRSAVNNWRASAIEGLTNAAIFLDDRDMYERALEMWREFVPSYIYIVRDGDRPNPFPAGLYSSEASQDCYWMYGPSQACEGPAATHSAMTYQNGQSAEVCRDFWHASAGIGGIVNTAETAHLQGDDLYGEQRTRIMAGVSYLLQIKQAFDVEGYPDGFCGGTGRGRAPLPEHPGAVRTMSSVVAYNHFANRLGLRFPMLSIPGYPHSSDEGDPVAAYIAVHQSGPTDTQDFVVAWQVLTHLDVGDGFTAESSRPPTTTPTAESEDRRLLASGLLVALIGLITGLGAVLTLTAARRRGQRG